MLHRTIYMFGIAVAVLVQPGMGQRLDESGDRSIVDQFDEDSNGWLNQAERSAARKYVKDNPVGRRGRGGPGQFGPPSGIRPDGPPPGFGPPESRPPESRPPSADGGGRDGQARPGSLRQRGAGRGRGRRGRGGPPGGRNLVATKPGEKIAFEDVDPIDAPLYDPDVLRTIFLDFENEDWEKELEDFHGTDVEVPATLTVDGKKYSHCGIRFRGMSSYMMVPSGHKRSLNVSIDFVDRSQRVLGYKTMNLLNCNGDESMLSTVLYSHVARKYMPAPKANLVRVVINGENWGVFTNVQQFNKDFLRENYPSAKGTRWKVSGSPRGGGGLDYRGPDADRYGHPYEMKGNDPNAQDKLIELCRVLDQTPIDELALALQGMLDVDEVLWFLALDNGLCNSDGYWVRASDFSIFLDKEDQFHIIPHDMNESFRQVGGRFGPPGGMRLPWVLGSGPNDNRTDKRGANRDDRDERMATASGLDPLIGLDDPSKPLRSKLLAVPELREQYLRNIRIIADELDWSRLGPVIKQYRELISEELERDTRKLGSYQAFLDSTSETIPEKDPGANRARRGGHGAMNLHQFSEERREFLLRSTQKK